MGIHKPLLDPFTQAEIMKFVDCYMDTGTTPCLPGHSETECEHLAMFLGLGYRRRWTDEERKILRENIPTLGPEETAALLPFRTAYDCAQKARDMHIKMPARRRMSCGSEWTVHEISILEKYYGTLRSKTAVLLPERSERSCCNMAVKLGLSNCWYTWSQEELELLWRFYPRIGDKVAAMLDGKDALAVRAKASSLGISAPKKRWTRGEDDLIRKYYPGMGDKVSEMFNGARSPDACRLRARKLGVYSERRKWTEEELEILDANYPRMGSDVCKLLPGRGGESCKDMAEQRGLVRSNKERGRIPWTEDELEILRQNYAELGAGVGRLLPRHSIKACKNMACRLGLTRDRYHWTEAELEILRRNYGEMGLEVTKLLPGRSDAACMTQARVMGLKSRCARWTEDEKNILREFYPLEGKKAYARIPNHPESSCKTMVIRLGLTVRGIHRKDAPE